MKRLALLLCLFCAGEAQAAGTFLSLDEARREGRAAAQRTLGALSDSHIHVGRCWRRVPGDYTRAACRAWTRGHARCTFTVWVRRDGRYYFTRVRQLRCG